MILLIKIFLAVIVFLMSSCVSKERSVEITPEDPGRYNTFAYLPNSNPDVPGKNYNDNKINTLIIETVNENLETAGYELNIENPVLLVLLSTKVNPETTTKPEFISYPYSREYATMKPCYLSYYYPGFRAVDNVIDFDTENIDYKEGTLVIKMVDREIQNTVWKGFTTDAIYEGTPVEIKGIVNEMFVEYPERPKSEL